MWPTPLTCSSFRRRAGRTRTTSATGKSRRVCPYEKGLHPSVLNTRFDGIFLSILLVYYFYSSAAPFLRGFGRFNSYFLQIFGFYFIFKQFLLLFLKFSQRFIICGQFSTFFHCATKKVKSLTRQVCGSPSLR